MCGIHGVLRFDGRPVAPETLAAMGNVTVHRGPDDAGQFVDGWCGIAMRRLSIIDLEGGHQPLSNVDETLWLVCNGEIYNYRELRAELVAKGFRFKTASDCEVLLHLYDAEGDAFVHRLNGMFDFALWDARRRRLLIGRDRLGVKPLYYLHDASRFAFATEAKALLTLPDVEARLDPAVVASYLHLGYVASSDSIFAGIRKLPPATLVAVENGEIREWRYWRMGPEVDTSISEETWVARVRDHLERSVRMQMVSDVPIGAFLSGGIDSSTVVGLMARATSEPVRTYAIGFDGGTAESLYNELPHARRVAEMFGTRHREILVRPDVVDLLPKLLWHMDEPIADSAFVTTYLVSQFAREDVKVILSGVGGDELFGGYRRYLGGHYADRYRRLPGWLRGAIGAALRRLPVDRHSGLQNRLRLAKSFVASAGLPPDERYRAYLQVVDRATVSALLLTPDAADGDPLTRAFEEAGSADELNRMFAVDAETQLPDDLLLLTDKMSMAVSLECRVPLLDHELVELAAAIPASVKVRGGRLKHLLKETLAGFLPREILEREKRGFGTPMGAWLRRDLKPVLRSLLARETVLARGLFRFPVVEALIRDHEAHRIDGTDALLSLMNLEIWSRIYLDDRSPADVASEMKSFLA